MADVPPEVCAFCGKGDELGSLRNTSDDEILAHYNCALYSPQVIERKVGKLDTRTVKEEIKRGKRLYCSYCKKKGATVGCDVRQCRKTYHYPCVKEDDGVYVKKEKIVYCFKHKIINSMTTAQKSSQNGVSETSEAAGTSHHLSKSNRNKTVKKRKRTQKDLKAVRKKIKFHQGTPETRKKTERRVNVESNNNSSHQLQDGRNEEDAERPGPSGITKNYHQLLVRIISETDTESTNSNVESESDQDSGTEEESESDQRPSVRLSADQRSENDSNAEVPDPPEMQSDDSCIVINSDDDLPTFNGSQLVYIKSEASQNNPNESGIGTPSGQSTNLVHSTPGERTPSSFRDPHIARAVSISGFPKRNKKRKTKRNNPELEAALPTMSTDERNAYSQLYDAVGGSLSISQEMPENDDFNNGPAAEDMSIENPMNNSDDGQSEGTDIEDIPYNPQPDAEEISDGSTSRNAESPPQPVTSDSESDSISLLHIDANTSHPSVDCTAVTAFPSEPPNNTICKEKTSPKPATEKGIAILQPVELANGSDRLVSTNGEMIPAAQYLGLRSGISTVASGRVDICDSRTVDINPMNNQADTLCENTLAPSNPNLSLSEQPMKSNSINSSSEAEQHKNSLDVNKMQSSNITKSASSDRPPNQQPVSISSAEHPMEHLMINKTSNEQSLTSSLTIKLSNEQAKYVLSTNKTSDEQTARSSLIGGGHLPSTGTESSARRRLKFPEEQVAGAPSKKGASEPCSIEYITEMIGQPLQLLNKEAFVTKADGSSQANDSPLAKKLEDSSSARQEAPSASYMAPDVRDVIASQPEKRAEMLSGLSLYLKELSDQLKQGAFCKTFSPMIPRIQSTVQSAKKMKWNKSQSSADAVIGACTGGSTGSTNNVDVEVSDAVIGAGPGVSTGSTNDVDVEVNDAVIGAGTGVSTGSTNDVDVEVSDTVIRAATGECSEGRDGVDVFEVEICDAVIEIVAGDVSGGTEEDGEVNGVTLAAETGMEVDGFVSGEDTDGGDDDFSGDDKGSGADDSSRDTNGELNDTGIEADGCDFNGDTNVDVAGEVIDTGIEADGCDFNGDTNVDKEVIGTDIGVDDDDSSGDADGMYGGVNGAGVELGADDSSRGTDGVDGEIDDADIDVDASDSSRDTDGVDGEVNDATNGVLPTSRSFQTEHSKGFPARCDQPIHLNCEQKNQLCESYQSTEKQMSRTGAAQTFWNLCLENKCREYLLTRIICCIKTVVHNIVHEEPDERDYDQAFVFLQATRCFTDFINGIQGEFSQTKTSSNMGSKKPCHKSKCPLLNDLRTLNSKLKAQEDITRDDHDLSGMEADLPETSPPLVNTSKDDSLRKEQSGGTENELPETSSSSARDITRDDNDLSGMEADLPETSPPLVNTSKDEGLRKEKSGGTGNELPETSSSSARDITRDDNDLSGMEADLPETSPPLVNTSKDESLRKEHSGGTENELPETSLSSARDITRDDNDLSGMEADLPETSSPLVNTRNDESLRMEHRRDTELPETSSSSANDRKVVSFRHNTDDKMETETIETSSSLARKEEENREFEEPDEMEAGTLQTSSTLMTSKKDDRTREEDCDRAQLKSPERPSVSNEKEESIRKGEDNRLEPRSKGTPLFSPSREGETALVQRSHLSSSASSITEVMPSEAINTNGMTSEQFQTLVIRMLEHIKEQNQSHWGGNQDGDMSFVKSLVPFLKKIPEDKKISTQIDLLNVLRKNTQQPESN